MPQAIPDNQDRETAIPEPPVRAASSDEVNAELNAFYDGVANRASAAADGSILKDVGKSTLSTLASTGTALAFVAEQAGIPGGKAVREAGENAIQFWQDSLSEQFKQSQSKKFLSDEEGKIFDEGIADPRKIIDLVVSNLPFMLVGGGFGAGITKAMLSRQAAKYGVGQIPKAQVVKAGIIGGGLGEGSVAAPLNAKQAFDEAMQVPLSTMAKTPAFKEAFFALPDSMPETERLNKAREAVAKTASAWVGIMTGASTSILGAPSGVWLAKLIQGEKGKNLISTMAKGFVLEGPGQELPQTIAEEIATGLAINVLDDERQIVGDDFAENLFGATLAGGITGGTLGAAGAQASPNAQTEPPQAETPPGDEPDPIADELRQILGMDQEQEETAPEDADASVELKGETTQATEESLPIGSFARFTTPAGQSFIGRAVARATQTIDEQTSQAFGIDNLVFEDAEGNVLPEIDVPGTVLRRDDETVFVYDGAEVTLLDKEESDQLEEKRLFDRSESLITTKIPQEHQKLRELIPQFLDKYPAGKTVNANDDLVIDLQKTVEAIKDKLGEKQTRTIVDDAIKAVEFVRQPQPAAAAQAESTEAVATEGAQTAPQLKKERAKLKKEAKSLRSQATKASALGFLAAKKASGAGTLGINKVAAEAEGIDTKGRTNVGGRTVFTKDGMSMDAAAELLNESGQFGKDIEANDVVEIINDELAGRPNKFTGQSAALNKQAEETETKLNLVEAQIDALKKGEFEAARESQRVAEDVFGDRSGVQAIEEALREGKLDQIYASNEYFDTIAEGGEFMTLSDLIDLAEDHDVNAVEDLLNITNITDQELAESLLEIINDEQTDEQTDSEEVVPEPTPETERERPTDVEKPVKTSPKPGVTAEPVAEKPKPEVKPEPEPEIEVSEDQVAKTLDFIAGPFEEPPKGISEITVNTKLPDDVALAAVAKLVKDGVIVKQEGIDLDRWSIAKPKGVRSPSQSAVNKAHKSITETLLNDDKLRVRLIEHAEDADTTDIRITTQFALTKALKEAYSDAWTGSEYFSAWSIAKIAAMRFNNAVAPDVDVFTDQFYNSLVAQALKRTKLLEKSQTERVRNRAISKAVGRNLKAIHTVLDNDGKLKDTDFAAVARKYIKGFRAAVDGKARALLTADTMEQRGFVEGRDWGQTGVGADFQRGKKGKKKEGIGPRLQRIHDNLGEQEWTEAEKMLRDVYRVTNRAKLFDVDPEEIKKQTGSEPTGGARRSLDKVKSQYATMAEALVRHFGLFGGGAPNKTMARHAKRQEDAGPEKFKEFQAEVKEVAEIYVSKASDIAKVFESQNSISGIIAGFNALAFKSPDKADLNEWGEDVRKRRLFTAHPQWPLRIYLDRLKRTESEPYVTKERIKPLRWKPVEHVIVTNSDRDGRDVSSAEFAKRFGIAGVTFGNWGTSKERINHLNWMWDSFNDIAKIMGIKPSLIGEGNTLHIAIGALGRGGKHSAHYSPNHPVDPDNPLAGVAKVINVTNKKGDGSVGHEWFHSMDFALDDRIRGDLGQYQTELVQMMRTLPKDELTVESFMDAFVNQFFGALSVNDKGELVRSRTTSTAPGVNWNDPAADKLRGALTHYLSTNNPENRGNRFNDQTSFYNEFVSGRQSQYYQQARKLDNFQSDAYWSSPVEMIARAGESFLVDKLLEDGGQNNYLVNDQFAGDGTVGAHTGYKGSPYPGGEERKAITGLYEQWAKDITWKAGKTPTISEGTQTPIQAITQPFYTEMQDFLANFDDRVATLEAEAKTKSEQIKKKLKEEKEARAGEIEELIEQTLESTDDSVIDENVGIEELDDDAIDQMLADANASINEGQQETSDATEQSTDERLGEEGVDIDGRQTRGRDDADNAPDDTGAAGQSTRGRKGQAGHLEDGRQSGRDAGGRGAGETGSAGDTAGLEAEELAGSGRKSAKPGRRSKGRNAKRLTKDENLKAANSAAKQAAKAGIGGLSDALTGLGELFGGAGKVNSFPAFDEETYQKAKPHFVDSYNKFVAAGKSLAEWFRYMLNYFNETFGLDVTPMLKRFAQEARAGTLAVDRRTGTDQTASETTEIVERKQEDELTDSVFDEYQPTFKTPEIVIPDGWQTAYHPGKLVQAAAMAAVALPEVSYTHNLPTSITSKGRVSPAQIEQVVLAGESFTNILEDGTRRGFFIGDGTGVGKGREIAAIMIDQMAAKGASKKAVWFSENFKLFDDAVRDYSGVTGQTASQVTSNRSAVPMFSGQGLSSIKGKKSGIMFQTYTTARQSKKLKTKDALGGESTTSTLPKVDQMVEWLGSDFDGVIAFDESHSMANSVPTKDKTPSAVAQAMQELRERLPNARLLFVSATGATELQNMGYLERLGLWGSETAFNDVFEFIEELKRGGKNVMEMIAHTMKAKGVYNARQLSWDGVRHDQLVHNMTDAEKGQWNTASDLFREMEKDFTKAVDLTGLVQIDREHKTGQVVNLTKSQTKAREQDFMLMMLTGFKAQTTINHAMKELKQGHAVVIQLTQTGEAATNRAMQDDELQKILEEEGRLFTLTPKELLLDFINRKFPIHYFQAELRPASKGKKAKMIGVPTDQVNPAAEALRTALIEKIKLLETPENAIDSVIKGFDKAKIKVSEVTGRIKNIKARSQNIKNFMDDEAQVLIFSSAGATGASYHAALNAKNQRKRQHYILQAGWRADKVLQGMGRTHRSDQRPGAEPKYWLTTTDYGPEKRFTSTIMRRLEQIGSLSSGERRAAGQGLFSGEHNIDGSYTHAAIKKTLNEMQFVSRELRERGFPSLFEFARTTGLDVLSPSGNLLDTKIPDLEKFLNRLLLARIDFGTVVFDRFFENLQGLINSAVADGTFNEGIETVVADGIETVSTEQIRNSGGLKTEWIKIRLETKTDILQWNDHISELREQENFEKIRVLQRRGSPQVFTARPIPKIEGQFAQQFELVGPYPQRDGKKLTNSKRLVLSEGQLFQYNELNDGNKPDFKAIAEIWKNEQETWPGGKFQEQNYLVGDILGIWDRLSFIEDVKLHRLKTDDGKVLIGRFIPPTKVNRARENLQAELAQAEMNPDVIYKMLLEGASIRLINNDEIKLRSVSDEEGAARKLVINPKGVKRDGIRRDRIESIYARFRVTHGGEINSGLEGFGVISSNEVFKKIIDRFPIAGIEGITDEQNEALTEKDQKADPDLWIEELTADEVEDLKRKRLTFVTDAFPKQKLFRVEGKKGQTFTHKERIKRAGAIWVNKLKRWIIGEELIDRFDSDMKDVLSAGPGSSGQGVSIETLTDVVNRIKAGWPNGPDIVAVNSVSEVTDFDFDLQTIKSGSVIAGLYQPQSGKIWLIADNLHSANHIASVLAHEMFHVGIRAMNLPGFNADAFLRRVFTSFRSHPAMKEVISEYSVHDLKTDRGRIMLADEFMAKLSEKGKKSLTPKERGLIRRFIDAVKRALGKIPMVRDYIATVSDTELLDIMGKSFKAAMDYTGPTPAVRAETMFSVGRPKLLYGVNEDGDVKMAAVPNTDGSYTVYTTEGDNLLDDGKLSKERVASKREVLKRMSDRALTSTLHTRRFGPRPSSSEIHVNYTVPDETRWDRLVSTFQDRFKRLNVTQQAFAEQGAKIDPDIDTYRAEERFHGLVFERIRAFEDNLVEPLMQSIADAGKRFGITQEDVDNYLYAKHAPEANAKLKTTNPEAEDNDQLSGHSDEWAEQTLADFESRGLTAPLEQIAKKVYSINNKRLDLIEREGLASKKAVKMIRDSYDFYVPLRGKPDRQAQIDGEDSSGMSVGKGLSASGRERYRFGRHSEAQDMMIHSVLMMEETLIRAEKNRVGKTFLKFIQKHPNRDLWTVNKRKSTPRFDKELGEVVWEARAYPPETMVVWDDGRENHIFIKDPILRKAMLGLNVMQVNKIVQGIAKITRFLAAVNTSFNPEFAASNLLRDLQTALVNLQDKDLLEKHGLNTPQDISKIGRSALKDLSPALRGAWHGLRGADKSKASESVKTWMGWFDDFRAHGGKIEFFSMNSIESKRKELTKHLKRLHSGKRPGIDQFIWLKDWVSDMNGAIENGIRLSTYKNLAERGIDRRVAASIARNLTVNFNRKGEVGNFMNAMFMFFNAGIQGTTRLFIAAKNPKIQKILMSLAAGGFFLAEMARWIGGDDEDGENNYDKIPDWVKEHNLVLMKADGSGGYYKIPLPYGYNVMNVIGVSVNKAWHSFDDGGAKQLAHDAPAQAVRIITGALNAFNPIGGDGGLLQMASPTVLDPFVQISANENFFGAPIRPVQPSYLQYDKPQSELYWSSVRPMTRDIAQFLNKTTGGSQFKEGWVDFSPEDMDHIWDFMFGGAGAFVGRSADWIYAVANDEDVKVRQIPLVRRFAADPPEFVVPGQYRENISELQQTKSALKQARSDGDRPEAVKIVAENAKILRLGGLMKSSESRLRKLRAARRKVENSKLPDAVKKARVKAINEKIDAIQKKFNRRFKDAQKVS